MEIRQLAIDPSCCIVERASSRQASLDSPECFVGLLDRCMRIDENTFRAPPTRAGFKDGNGVGKRRQNSHILAQCEITGRTRRKNRHAGSRGVANFHRRRLTNIPVRANQPKKIGCANTVQMPVLNKAHRSDGIAGHEEELSLCGNDPGIRWRKYTYGTRGQLSNSRADRFHVPMKAAGYGDG